ncbi:MAG: four helix bundle protein [Gammaproteobacteria bacterium]|nr:four helix bundle protein [Gammaproteobacteria bacterium]
MAVGCYRELRVWQDGMDLVAEVYAKTRSFPKTERYGLTWQLRRAAVVVPSSIAEGHTREHARECLPHIGTARAALAEVETQVELARRLGYLEAEEADPLVGRARDLARRLGVLRDVLRRSPSAA